MTLRCNTIRKWIYGVDYPLGNEAIYLECYRQYNEEIMAHFRDRSDDLPILRLTEREGWEKLCSFLGMQTPSTEFTPKNKTQKESVFCHVCKDL